MPTGESARHALYSELQDLLSPENADTLMTHLPQHPSDEVATSRDVAALRSDFQRLEARFDRLEDKIDRMQRFYVGTVVGSMTALTAIFSFVVALIR
jgi:hypothetical protein